MTIQKQKGPSVYRHALQMAGVAAVVVVAGVFASVTGARQAAPLGAGDDLQAALDRASPGDEIRLAPGAVFEGNFVLPAKAGDGVITIRTDAADGDLPSAGERIEPDDAARMPSIRSPNSGAALRTAPGARHWRIMGVIFEGTGGADIVVLGDGTAAQDTYEEVPSDIELDRVIVRGDATRGQKRGIALNSASTTIRNSRITGIKEVGQETQAIAGWNGPGPFLIENNHLEAAGINILFGGAAPHIGSLVPSDIVVRGNTLTKPLAWRESRWTVKNLFELKNARRVLVEGNLLEHNWSEAQVGFAILFTVRNPGNVAPWSTIEDVTFQHNIVRGVAAGVNILGHDTHSRSQQVRGIVIRNNLFEDVNGPAWGGNGVFLQVGDEPADITVEHNTVIQTGNVITAYGGTRASPRPIRGFRFAHNIALHNAYGIFGNGYGTGTTAMNVYFPDGEIEGNVLAGGASSRYPAGNAFPSVDELMSLFVSPGEGDYRLRPDALASLSTSGNPPGVDHAALMKAMRNARGSGLR